jgi:CRP/FNR family transcriptional regulator
VRCIPDNAIEKLIRSEPGFGQAILFLTASELAETREQMLSLGRKSAAEKLATFLLRISRRSMAIGQSGNILSIPMKRSEIADFLGLTIETVSRTFTRLRVARVIQLQANSQVEVIDMEQLKSIAEGEATAAVH